jgi:hypothetical protein
MKVEAPNDRPLDRKNRKGLERNPCDKWVDTLMNWVRNQNSYRPPAMSLESLLALLTSLLDLQRCQKACCYTTRS